MYKNTKVDSKNTELFELFKATTNWHKARIKCIVLIVQAMIKLQSVSYTKIAQGFDSNATYESNLRRIQRFFAKFYFDPILFSKLIFKLIAVVAIAFIWAYLAGIDKHENLKPIKTKKHGRKAYKHNTNPKR